jgi:pyrroline-5-carboxylate reductase
MVAFSDQKIVFVGAGSMAEAIIRGLLGTGVAKPEQLFAINRTNELKTSQLRELYKIHATCEPALAKAWIHEADIVVAGMKPQNAASSLLAYKTLINDRQLFISIIAGLSIDTIQDLIGDSIPIVRTMPNTSSHIGLGATGISFSESVSEKQKQLTTTLFAAIGETVIVEESLINTVTSLSGSGPAYLYYVMEAMINAGIEGGLSAETAKLLTVQTVLGAASMVRHTGEHPVELRRKVTSPNGTTQAAITRLEEFRFQEALQIAMARCAERAEELREMISRDAHSLQQGGTSR